MYSILFKSNKGESRFLFMIYRRNGKNVPQGLPCQLCKFCLAIRGQAGFQQSALSFKIKYQTKVTPP